MYFAITFESLNNWLMKAMNNNKNTQPGLPPNNNTSAIVGVAIILFGVFILLKNLDFDFLFPSWLFKWNVILIIIGLVIGVNSKFEKKSSIILIGIGTLFLAKDIFGGFNPLKILFPALAIIFGIYIINRNRKNATPPIPPQTPPSHPTDEFDWDRRVTDFENTNNGSENNNSNFANENTNHSQSQFNYTHAENYLKLDTVFGSSNKIVLSKNFLGGNVTNIFGSTVINLLQADLTQPIAIDVFQLFSSTKIIVPPHWYISNNASSILSENDDRRVILNHPFDESKKVFITGTSIFSTLIIKNS